VSTDAVPAIHVSSSYLFDSSADLLKVSRGDAGYVYRRYGNENCNDLAIAVSQLEGAAEAVCLTCGMAAVSSSIIGAGILSGGKTILGKTA
jgi:cystathionine beta-lyase/cystathionine gamma-synthase